MPAEDTSGLEVKLLATMENGPRAFWLQWQLGLADELYFTGFLDLIKKLDIIEPDTVALSLFYKLSPN
jgi:hypothetical protein